jgi:hypothetical protein
MYKKNIFIDEGSMKQSDMMLAQMKQFKENLEKAEEEPSVVSKKMDLQLKPT